MAQKTDTTTIRNSYLNISTSVTNCEFGEHTQNALVLAPFVKVPKLDFGQVKINETVERTLLVHNAQEFNVELSVYMSSSKSNEILHLTFEPNSGININIKWKPEKADTYSYTIIFEVTNITKLKFSVNTFGVCIEEQVRKTSRMLRPLVDLNPNQLSKETKKITNEVKAHKTTDLFPALKREKENVPQLTLGTKIQKTIPRPLSCVIPIKSNKLAVPPTVTIRQRSTSRDGPKNTAERARLRSDKNLNKIEVPKPVHNNFLKGHSNKTSSNYKSIQIAKNVSNNSTEKNNQNVKKIIPNQTFSKSTPKLKTAPPFDPSTDKTIKMSISESTPKSKTAPPFDPSADKTIKMNISENRSRFLSICNSCDNMWLEKDESTYCNEAKPIITSTQKVSFSTNTLYPGIRQFCKPRPTFDTPKLDHYKSTILSGNSTFTKITCKDDLSLIKMDRSGKTLERDENSENNSLYYHELSYLNASSTYIKYQAIENL